MYKVVRNSITNKYSKPPDFKEVRERRNKSLEVSRGFSLLTSDKTNTQATINTSGFMIDANMTFIFPLIPPSKSSNVSTRRLIYGHAFYFDQRSFVICPLRHYGRNCKNICFPYNQWRYTGFNSLHMWSAHLELQIPSFESNIVIC